MRQCFYLHDSVPDDKLLHKMRKGVGGTLQGHLAREGKKQGSVGALTIHAIPWPAPCMSPCLHGWDPRCPAGRASASAAAPAGKDWGRAGPAGATRAGTPPWPARPEASLLLSRCSAPASAPSTAHWPLHQHCGSLVITSLDRLGPLCGHPGPCTPLEFALKVGSRSPGSWAALHTRRAPACHLALPPDPLHVLFVMQQRCPEFGHQLEICGTHTLPSGIKY